MAKIMMMISKIFVWMVSFFCLNFFSKMKSKFIYVSAIRQIHGTSVLKLYTHLKLPVYTFCNDLCVSLVLKVFYFVLQTCMRDMGISDDDINGKNCGQTSVRITVLICLNNFEYKHGKYSTVSVARGTHRWKFLKTFGILKLKFFSQHCTETAPEFQILHWETVEDQRLLDFFHCKISVCKHVLNLWFLLPQRVKVSFQGSQLSPAAFSIEASINNIDHQLLWNLYPVTLQFYLLLLPPQITAPVFVTATFLRLGKHLLQILLRNLPWQLSKFMQNVFFSQRFNVANMVVILSSCCVALFRVVSAVLQFGNMVFKQERSSEQAIMPSNEGQYKVCYLL